MKSTDFKDYKTSRKIKANGDNLQDQLENSLNVLCKELKCLDNTGSYGVHFIYQHHDERE